MEILTEAIAKYGAGNQIEMLIEECSEVIHAVQKCKRENTEAANEHLHEELADLSIMIDQMYLIFPGKIEPFKEQKLLRLQKRLLS